MGITAAGFAAWMATYGAAAAAVTSVAAGAISYKMTSDANKAAEDAADAQNKALNEEAIRQYGELDKVESDAIYESHATSLEAQKQLMEARSSVQLQAAVTGTYGNSVNVALQDIKTGFGGRMADIVQQRDSQLDEVNDVAERIQSQTGAQKVTAIKKPAFWSAIQTGLSTYQTTSGIARSVGATAKQASPANAIYVNGKMTAAPKLATTATGYRRTHN